MGQQGWGVPQEVSARSSQGLVDGQVLPVQGSGGFHELLRGQLSQSVQGPAQVHRRRSAGEEHRSGLFQVAAALGFHGQPIGGGDGDGRGPAHHHARDGLSCLGRGAAHKPLL